MSTEDRQDPAFDDPGKYYIDLGLENLDGAQTLHAGQPRNDQLALTNSALLGSIAVSLRNICAGVGKMVELLEPLAYPPVEYREEAAQDLDNPAQSGGAESE